MFTSDDDVLITPLAVLVPPLIAMAAKYPVSEAF
jgi:hypothetical protein